MVCDLGETLVDESALWSELADQVGVPRFTFMATLGGLIARGRDHREMWDELGIDRPRYWPEHAASDLYPDAAEFLKDLRRLGITVGIAGNQPERTESLLKDMGLPADFVPRRPDGVWKSLHRSSSPSSSTCVAAHRSRFSMWGIASTTTSSLLRTQDF